MRPRPERPTNAPVCDKGGRRAIWHKGFWLCPSERCPKGYGHIVSAKR